MGTKKCPECGLINPPSTIKCDCGYDFQTGKVNHSFHSGTVKKPKLKEQIDAIKKQNDILRAMILEKSLDVIKWGLIIIIAAVAFYIVYPKYDFIPDFPFKGNKFTGEMG